MVHKKLLELLVNLAIAFLVLSVSISESCHLSQGTFYNRCLSGINCTSGIDCVSEPVVVYDWMWDLGGCDLGCAAGQLYDVYDANSVQCTGSIYGKTCQCYVKEAKWKKSCSNGDTCKLKWNPLCDGEFEGKWDASEGKCVKCSGKSKSKRMHVVMKIITLNANLRAVQQTNATRKHRKLDGVKVQ